MQKGEIKALTGIRGIAAVLVALYHLYPTNGLHIALLSHTLGRGYLCVDLFFVLSGFVMAYNYARPFAREITSQSIGDFLLRRIARIYPLYLVLLVVRIVWTLAVYGQFHAPQQPFAVTMDDPAHDILANLLLVQSWGLSFSINGPAWSVSTEWAAYFLFPLLVIPALFRPRRSAWLLGIAAALLVVAAVALDLHDGAYHSGSLDAYDGTRAEPMLRCLGGFTLGLLAYRAAQSERVQRAMAPDWVGFALVAAFFAGLAGDVRDLLLYPVFPLLVLHLAVSRGRLAALMSTRVAMVLGVLSYSIYLLHPYLILPLRNLEQILSTWLPPVLALPLAGVTIGVTVLLLSAAAYACIERPGRRLIRALPFRPRSSIVLLRHGVRQ